MSTRVLKGTPKFKPVAKTKPRPSETLSNQNINFVQDISPFHPSGKNQDSNVSTRENARNNTPNIDGSTVVRDIVDSDVEQSVRQGSMPTNDPVESTSQKNSQGAILYVKPAADVAEMKRLNNDFISSDTTDNEAPHVYLQPLSALETDIGSTERGRLCDEISVRENEFSSRQSKRSSEFTDGHNSSSRFVSNSEAVKKNKEGSAHKRRESSNRKETRSRNSIPRVEYFSPDIEQGQDLDPTLVTMANLCSDTGQGRMSSKAAQIQQNHSTWKLTNKEKRARLRSLLEARKYGFKEPVDDQFNLPDASSFRSSRRDDSVDVNLIAHTISRGSVSVSGSNAAINAIHDFDYSEALSTNDYNVRVRVGPNGETILDEETLYVDRAADPAFANEKYTHIEESDQTKFVNSQTYSKKPRGSRWTSEETELFYNALAQFGENYELISLILPGRDRQSCKNKFKAEDKKNPNRITLCLKNRIPYDMQTLSRMTGKDFSGPVPVIRAPSPPNLDHNTVAPFEHVNEIHPSLAKEKVTNMVDGNEEIMYDMDFEGDV